MIIPLFVATVKHNRANVNQFSYKTVSSIFNLGNLKDYQSKFFAYNKWAVFSLWDKDYLPGVTGDLKNKLYTYLRQANLDNDWAKIEFITCPRFIFYVFNPVSFFLLYRQSSEYPELCVAEVNNTFKETHLYIAEFVEYKNKFSKFKAKKEFHVSPFYDRQGEYEFYVYRGVDEVKIRVNLIKENKTVFTSSIGGKLVYPENALKAFLLGARYIWITFPLITLQAIKLKYQKGLKFYTKPVPNSNWTIGKRNPGLFQLVSFKIITKYFDKIQNGTIKIELPDGSILNFGKGDKTASIKVNDWSFFVKLLLGSDIAFGECYSEQIIEVDDLTKCLEIFAENMENIDERSILFSKIKQYLNKLSHKFNFNSKRGSKNNISAHYDLGNKLFEKFLDSNLVYSSAIYDKEADNLEAAQIKKINELIKKARITKDDHVLEIGSGWGAFAITAAKNIGCKITTITLSEEQFEHVKNKVRNLKLEDKIEIKLCDYRDLKGKFDKIVSIEMLEAVGHENLPLYFKKCFELLNPKGLLALQVITFPDSRYESYRTSCDWIQKYIFPGGLCPSFGAIEKASNEFFNVDSKIDIGKSYARTLRDWKSKFKSNSAELENLGYDKYFQRTWDYYFSYCEAGFNSAGLETLQLVMTKLV